MAVGISFIENLIYGTGITPNHEDWLVSGATSGADWLDHYLDRMLPEVETWLSTQNQPPLVPWDGVYPTPWDTTNTIPLGTDLDGSFTGVNTLELLGQALRNRYTTVAGQAWELNGVLKAPFSYRFWGYLKWAWTMRERFLGNQVFPTGVVFDRDGTILSAVPFCDAFNDLHRNWHSGSAASGVVTPGLKTTAGQRSRFGILGGANRGEEFLRFHREHSGIFFGWLKRNGQASLLPVDMGQAGGTPPNPTTPSPAPWALDELSVPASWQTDPTFADPNTIGNIEFGYHVAGHVQNTDIGPLAHNNYVPRFHTWHGWIDAQWWWREPRFAWSDPTSGARDRVFRPVLQDDSDFPGLQALSIIRDTLAAVDTLYPATALGGWDALTGDASLRFKMYVRDPFGRPLRLRLTVETFSAAGVVVPALTQTVLRNIGPAGDHPLDTEFYEDISLPGVFGSDDPTRANPAVGFVNSRVKITGHLWVPDGVAPDDPTQSPDPGFVHEDVAILELVHEKSAPDALIYQNLSSFSEDQVNSAMTAGVAAFEEAFYLVTQDRFTPPFPAPVWPAATADEVKGLILGEQAASGLFDDVLHAPQVEIWYDTVDTPIMGMRAVLEPGSPDKEDPSLPPEIPQRYTWRYRIEFNTSNDAFTGIALGGSRFARLRATVRDRAGNSQTIQTNIKLFKDANPYMMDGNPFWLSTDTRTFSVMAGQTHLGVTMVAGQPFNYLTQVLNRLNANLEDFNALPKEGAGAALEYAQQIPNPSTGVATSVYNFAIAQVRLQGAGGATNVRAFFRLFRYTAPSLLFNPNSGYRAYSDGAGRIVPLLGFQSETAGAALTSIPFFAEARRNPLAESMTAQTDAANVYTFPPGPTAERIRYFGVYLDINDPAARLPQTYNAASPNGPFAFASLQSLRTLMHDFHQCMVVEIRYDGDPTTVMDSPSASDNLAQRNLAILESDNPGDPYTRTVEHSFEIDLTRPAFKKDMLPVLVDLQQPAHRHTDHPHEGGNPQDTNMGDILCGGCGHTELDKDGRCACCGGLANLGPLDAESPRNFQSTFKMEKLLVDEAMSLAFLSEDGMKLMAGEDHHHAVVERFGTEAARRLQTRHPFVFHPTRWAQTAAAMDELMIRWNNLPKSAKVRMFLPGLSAEEIVNLRSLRHAPRTVFANGGSELRLDVTEVTYLPIPPVRGNRQAALISIELPEGIKAGQVFTVDVSQLRAGSTVENGAFRIEIPIGKARHIFPAVERNLVLTMERLSLTPAQDRWRPILERRLQTERRRAGALAERLNLPEWKDPTQWVDEQGQSQPVTGMKIRVVLEKIKILETCEPWWKGAGEVDFEASAWTPDNGGILQHTRLPQTGHWKARTGDVLNIETVIFEGIVRDRLSLKIRGMERDFLDPDDHLGVFYRNFSCDPNQWLKQYMPGDERVDPEDLEFFQLWYRIEKG